MNDTQDIEIRDFDKAYLNTGSFGVIAHGKDLKGAWVGRIGDYELHGKYEASADLSYTPEVLVYNDENKPAKMTASNVVVRELEVDTIHPIAGEEQVMESEPLKITQEMLDELIRQKQQQLDTKGVELKDNVDEQLGYGDEQEHISYTFKDVLSKNGDIRRASFQENPFTVSLKEDELLTAETKVSRVLGLTTTTGNFTVIVETPFLTADGKKINGSIELDVGFSTEDKPWLEQKTAEVKGLNGETLYEPDIKIEAGFDPEYITTKVLGGRFYDEEGFLLSNVEKEQRIDHVDPLIEKHLQERASHVATHHNELTNNPEKASQLKGLKKGLLSGFSISEKQVSDLSISGFSHLEATALKKASYDTYPINEELGGITKLTGALGGGRNNKAIKGEAWLDVEGEPTKVKFIGSFEKNYEPVFNGDLQNPDLVTKMVAEDINIRHVGLVSKGNPTEVIPLDKKVANNIRRSLNQQLSSAVEQRMNNNTELWLKEELQEDLEIVTATSDNYPMVDSGRLTKSQLKVSEDLLKTRENVFGTSRKMPVEYSLASKSTTYKENDIKSAVINALDAVKPQVLEQGSPVTIKSILELDLNDESQELHRRLKEQLSVTGPESEFAQKNGGITDALVTSKSLRASIYVNEYYKNSIFMDDSERKQFVSNLHDGFSNIVLTNHKENISTVSAVNDKELSIEERWLEALYEESRREQYEIENHPSNLQPNEVDGYKEAIKNSLDNSELAIENLKLKDDVELNTFDASIEEVNTTLDKLLSEQKDNAQDLKITIDDVKNDQEQEIEAPRYKGPSM